MYDIIHEQYHYSIDHTAFLNLVYNRAELRLSLTQGVATKGKDIAT